MNLGQARVLVTGGAGGIGSAIAAELLAAGARVMLADVNGEALDGVAGRLGAADGCLATAVADLTDTASRARLCQQAIAWGVNVVVNNAGVSHFGLHEELTPAQLAQTMSINILAPMLLVAELLPHLKQQPQAQLLNMGSVFGHIGYPGYAAYSASKFALRGFSEALRRELADSRVRVHYLAPRATRTPLNSAAVTRMNAELHVAMDPPAVVARAVRRILQREIPSAVIGWPEKLFARVNALLPGVVDGAIRRQLPVIRRHARRQDTPSMAATAAPNPGSHPA
ncbi:putative oxidoreductase [Gammaproteobacteria bacterium]|nr:SDR family oxidoreductase [Gammaproteobacteria bacterium]CAG0941462.1 putative oxidoreductase [Gammaproteobacteria bacterium]